MIVTVILLLLVVAFLVGYMIWQTSEPPAQKEVDPEQAIKAAVELRRIRRRFDAARLKSEQRSAGARVRREIADALKADE